eukprot:gnl/TRDRNA2_/TRDRNA2_63894_c0_seq1.p1 gnl/TRDRNA2_/TRDRNA2_63894_c0~~gnl/TRDRNA2_/TRDRNA2_63894_c0_seq1.p1  ORF type:complete len:191 (+),score=35.03 gnl/TRDRNA2_/TRDRNA2_63894_c0_seq1:58-573(+)
MSAGAPYCILSHGFYCSSCQRDVEDDEMVVNDDGYYVHLGCGTCLEELGHILPTASDRCFGKDHELIDGCVNRVTEADWMARQLEILESLPKGAGAHAEAQRQAALAAVGAAVVAERSRDKLKLDEGPSRMPCEAGKIRRGPPTSPGRAGPEQGAAAESGHGQHSTENFST